MKLLNRRHLQQVGQDASSQLVVIAVKLGNLALLDLVDECLTTVIVDIVVLELQLLQGLALLHQICDKFGTDRGDLVIGKDQRLELLLLLVRKGANNDLNTFIADGVASEIENSNGFAVSHGRLQFLDTAEADIVALEAQNLEILLILQGFAESSGTIREHTII